MRPGNRLNLVAVLGFHSQDRWCGIQLNSIHDANNMDEVQRIRDEHPDEADAIRNDRVIGFLEPTRGRFNSVVPAPTCFI